MAMNPKFFSAIGEPRRLQILQCLSSCDRSVGELVAELGSNQPSVSKHLKVLKDCGFVQVQVDGQRRIYQLRKEPFQEMAHWLASYQRLWHDKLDNLEEFLAEENEQQEQAQNS